MHSSYVQICNIQFVRDNSLGLCSGYLMSSHECSNNHISSWSTAVSQWTVTHFIDNCTDSYGFLDFI